MTRTEAFALLGVPLDADASQLRRAYMKGLRRHKPDQDPEGFMRWRAAYELAQQPAGSSDVSGSRLRAPAGPSGPQRPGSPLGELVEALVRARRGAPKRSLDAARRALWQASDEGLHHPMMVEAALELLLLLHLAGDHEHGRVLYDDLWRYLRRSGEEDELLDGDVGYRLRIVADLQSLDPALHPAFVTMVVEALLSGDFARCREQVMSRLGWLPSAERVEQHRALHKLRRVRAALSLPPVPAGRAVAPAWVTLLVVFLLIWGHGCRLWLVNYRAQAAASPPAQPERVLMDDLAQLRLERCEGALPAWGSLRCDGVELAEQALDRALCPMARAAGRPSYRYDGLLEDTATKRVCRYLAELGCGPEDP